MDFYTQPGRNFKAKTVNLFKFLEFKINKCE